MSTNEPTLPFHAVDIALADRLCDWHKNDDPLLWQTIAATSFALQQGHTCLNPALALQTPPYNALQTLGGMAFPDAKAWLSQLSAVDLSPNGTSPFVLDYQRFYLRRYWQFETEVAEFIQHRWLHPPEPLGTPEQQKILLADLFPASQSSHEIDWQQVACANALQDSLHIIVGGPGTGKTYTVTRLLAALQTLCEGELKIKLAAPTGKAAQRMGEAIREAKVTLPISETIRVSIPDSASTLHRLLGVIPNQNNFRHNADNPIDADVLLIDEVSMIDLPLMARLCRAIAPHTRVILLGDADQLPSVAAGSVLADLVQTPHSGYSQTRIASLQTLVPAGASIPVVNNAQDHATELKVSRRFSADSGIGALARAVIAGAATEATKTFHDHTDLQWHSQDQLGQVVQQLVTQHYRAIAQQPNVSAAFAKLQEARLLCAVREGDQGVETLNARMTQMLNPSGAPFFQGQPIMVTQNHYGLGLYNGDIAIVWPDDQGVLMAWFEVEDHHRPVALGRLPAVEPVYAMTIHKTQGSEFGNVVLVLPEQPSPLLTRELIYTGLTRAKQRFEVVGRAPIWHAGVQARVHRFSGLAERLAVANTPPPADNTAEQLEMGF